MDWRSTHTMLHEQAIYQHEGGQYQVERLDFGNHKAFVRRVKPDYYTTAMTHSKVTVLEHDQGATIDLDEVPLEAGLGDVTVIEKVVGYKKIKFHTHENVGYGEVHLPEMQKHTTVFWLTFPEDFVDSQPEPRAVIIDALRGLSKAMHLVGAVGLMIDPRDLGRTLGSRTEDDTPPGKGRGPGYDPTIFLYDTVAGGVGLAPRLFEEREELLRRARHLIESCGCEEGCPGCIGPDASGDDEPEAARKQLVLGLLDAVGIRATH
jgi:DEAD/DEAH box helicase domain-containing protein